MPIKIENDLPAALELEKENIFVMTESRATTQDIRPLKILILNLMPTKETTEKQLLRLLGNSPLQVDAELLQMASHRTRNTSAEHMFKYYKTLDEIRDCRYDGMIFTGAPVEMLPFDEVDYWSELKETMDWALTHVYSCYFICWGAQAALYHKYGVPKYTLPKKLSGVYEHTPLDRYHPLLRGLDDSFWCPHSRNTEVRLDDIVKISDLQVLSYSREAGIHMISDMDCRNFYVFGHFEYDADTLSKEYIRDTKKGLDVPVPCHYFPGDDPEREPIVRWRGTANLVMQNWLNYFVYQKTPYNLTELG
ncbi:MAG: homoserine O-succinyltransferase [Clostridia bacterium]|nr:homoserine O-succinyltransferase [Clostridia bacterium]